MLIRDEVFISGIFRRLKYHSPYVQAYYSVFSRARFSALFAQCRSPPPPNYVHEPVKFSIFLKCFFCCCYFLFDSKKTFAVELVTNCINLKCKFFSILSRVVKYILNTVIKSSFEINAKWNQLRNFINAIW